MLPVVGCGVCTYLSAVLARSSCLCISRWYGVATFPCLPTALMTIAVRLSKFVHEAVAACLLQLFAVDWRACCCIYYAASCFFASWTMTLHPDVVSCSPNRYLLWNWHFGIIMLQWTLHDRKAWRRLRERVRELLKFGLITQDWKNWLSTLCEMHCWNAFVAVCHRWYRQDYNIRAPGRQLLCYCHHE